MHPDVNTDILHWYKYIDFLLFQEFYQNNCEKCEFFSPRFSSPSPSRSGAAMPRRVRFVQPERADRDPFRKVTVFPRRDHP
jgi:hypothetical protein